GGRRDDPTVRRGHGDDRVRRNVEGDEIPRSVGHLEGTAGGNDEAVDRWRQQHAAPGGDRRDDDRGDDGRRGTDGEDRRDRRGGAPFAPAAPGTAAIPPAGPRSPGRRG